MATSFNNLAHEVVTARKNWGAPKSMQLKESISTRELAGKKIVIDEIVVMNKKKIDKETKTVVKTKDGKEMFQPVVYVAFDKDNFFATKSAILVEQLERLTNKKLAVYEEKDFVVTDIETDLKGKEVKIGAEKVKYRDGKEYDQLILLDAE